MNSTLDELIDNINANLKDIYGSSVKSALEVCKNVREIIKENEFYKSLEKNGLEELLVFKDDIENMGFIFLSATKDDEETKPIIKIVWKINYFDEADYSKGGVIDFVTCKPIGLGIKILTLPLAQIVMALDLKNTQIQEHTVNNKISDLEKELKELKEKSLFLAKKRTGLIKNLGTSTI